MYYKETSQKNQISFFKDYNLENYKSSSPNVIDGYFFEYKNDTKTNYTDQILPMIAGALQTGYMDQPSTSSSSSFLTSWLPTSISEFSLSSILPRSITYCFSGSVTWSKLPVASYGIGPLILLTKHVFGKVIQKQNNPLQDFVISMVAGGALNILVGAITGDTQWETIIPNFISGVNSGVNVFQSTQIIKIVPLLLPLIDSFIPDKIKNIFKTTIKDQYYTTTDELVFKQEELAIFKNYKTERNIENTITICFNVSSKDSNKIVKKDITINMYDIEAKESEENEIKKVYFKINQKKIAITNNPVFLKVSYLFFKKIEESTKELKYQEQELSEINEFIKKSNEDIDFYTKNLNNWKKLKDVENTNYKVLKEYPMISVMNTESKEKVLIHPFSIQEESENQTLYVMYDKNKKTTNQPCCPSRKTFERLEETSLEKLDDIKNNIFFCQAKKFAISELTSKIEDTEKSITRNENKKIKISKQIKELKEQQPLKEKTLKAWKFLYLRKLTSK